MAAVADHQAALELAEPVHLDLGLGGVPVDAVAVGADLRDGESVRLTLVAELHLAADGVAGAGSPTAGRRKERLTLELLLGVVDIDGGGDQRDISGAGRHVGRARVGAVQPAGVGGRRDDLFAVEQVEQEGLGGGAAAQHDRGLPQRRAQPGQCLGAVAAPGDDLGDHGVVVGRDDVALRDAGVDAQAAAERELEQLHRAGGGCESVGGVFGVEPGFDGVAELGRAVTHEGSPLATRICNFTRSIPVVASVMGCSTCNRVFTSRKVKVFCSGW